MIHAKFQENRTSGSGEVDCLKVLTIYGHGGHLCHVTSWTNYINFRYHFPKRLRMKFCIDWPSTFREEAV